MMSMLLIALLLAACGVGAPGEGNPGDGSPIEDEPVHGDPGDGIPDDGEPGDGDPGDGNPGDGEPGDGNPDDGGPDDGEPGEGRGELEAALALVNSLRAESRYCGPTLYPAAPALTLDSRLNAAAQTHSDYMATNNHFSHTWSDGTHPADRIAAQGYRGMRVGENIALGQRSYEQAIHDWLGSPGHCSNIMSPNFRHMGLASASADNGRQYWTQVFAAPY